MFGFSRKILKKVEKLFFIRPWKIYFWIPIALLNQLVHLAKDETPLLCCMCDRQRQLLSTCDSILLNTIKLK